MKRATATLLALAVGTGCGSGDESVEAGRRSVILVSLDTLRADHMGLYGYERDTTPYLDRLAEESLVFERAFAPSAWTLISHMTMLTGLYSHQHGVVEADRALAHDTPLLAQRMQALGYQTIGLYYEGWINARHGFDRGFEVFRAHEDVRQAGEHLAQELAKRDPDRPLFLFLHLFDIHCGPLTTGPGPIYRSPPPYDEMFLDDAAARIPAVAEKKIWKSQDLLDEEAIEGLVALYDGGIRYVDDQLATWIEGFRTQGLLDEALLAITADHGEALAQRGRVGDHGGGFQEGLRVPMILRHPTGWRAGEREAGTVHLADLAPTILAFAGDRRAQLMPGISLLEEVPDDRLVFSSNPKNYEILVQWPNKWIHLPRDGRYIHIDLAADPEELSPRELTQDEFEELRARFHQGGGAPEGWAPAVQAGAVDAADLERLNDMGYGGEE